MLTVYWIHGKDAAPMGMKSTAIAAMVRERGLGFEAPDFRAIDTPDGRLNHFLVILAQQQEPPVVVGSSLGGYVAAAAALQYELRAVLLLCPALYLPGCSVRDYSSLRCPATLIHGWRDVLIPPEDSFRFAQEHKATLHLVDADHQLNGQVPFVCAVLGRILDALENAPQA